MEEQQKRFGYLSGRTLHIGKHKFDTRRMTASTVKRFQRLINSDTTKSWVELDEDLTPTVYFKI